MITAAARAVQPPDLSLGTFDCDAWSMASTGVAPIPALIEEDGRLGSVEEEGAPRCSDLESIPDGKATVEVSTGRAGGPALHGDPVVRRVGRTGEGVVPEHRLAPPSGWMRRVRY